MSVLRQALPRQASRDSRSELSRTVFILGEGVAEAVVPAHIRSHEAFREWAISDDFPEQGRFTLVNRELNVDTSAELLESHSEVKSEISRVLLSLVRKRKLGSFYIDRVLISNLTAGLSNEPDALFVRREALEAGDITLTPTKGDPRRRKEIVGTVDWVLEVVSLDSEKKDKGLLRKTYYDAGIPEYWLVDALGETIEFEILVPGDGAYVSVESVEDWKTSPTFGAAFRLTYEQDEDGSWLYTLEIRDNP